MTPQEIKQIHTILTTRVSCQNAREGVAIFELAAKLVSHFAKANAPQQDSQQPSAPASAAQ